MDSDDETYEELVKAVQSALSELEDYVASSRPSEAVVETSEVQPKIAVSTVPRSPAAQARMNRRMQDQLANAIAG